MSARLPILGPDLRGAVLERRYRLDEFIASGGSGTVFAGIDLRLGREVAVKVIHPEYARHPEQRLRIRQEALLGARITHEHVAQILDFGEHHAKGERLPFIVMPLLRGRSLREETLSGSMSWQAAGAWVHQLLLGLSALHREGVIHRDVKPDNCILVAEGGRRRLKLIDLGLAKVTREGLLSRPPWSVAGRVVGSLHYISPQQALGEELDERADVYAAGVVLFELLTRIQPFGGSDYEILNGHVEQPVPSPKSVAPLAGVPDALDAITMRAMAKSPEARYGSAMNFDAALVGVLSDGGVDVDRSPAPAGCVEAQASLAAWANFDHERAVLEIERAARLDKGWSPLATLLEVARDTAI